MSATGSVAVFWQENYTLTAEQD